ncbi:hypothetical protein [Antribacter gilvus]|uniref:hypothetical protein n=1 Tax=Antribacter gilvus TaxID=2304675 RepID=UPI000F767CD6|nr:hypothetical protein [Antribacter gilvus]
MNDEHTPVSRTGISKALVPDGPNPFAVHGDPSGRRDAAPGSENSRGLRWARLTDLHHDPKVVGGLVRGVDLYGHLMRGIRRAPVRAAKAAARGLAPAVPAHRTVRAATRQEVEPS